MRASQLAAALIDAIDEITVFLQDVPKPFRIRLYTADELCTPSHPFEMPAPRYNLRVPDDAAFAEVPAWEISESEETQLRSLEGRIRHLALELHLPAPDLLDLEPPWFFRAWLADAATLRLLATGLLAETAVERADDELPPLDPEDVAILRYLAEHPGLATFQADIAAGADIDRKTVGKRLKHLRSVGYVAHPPDKKRGNLITQTGLKRLEKCPTTSP